MASGESITTGVDQLIRLISSKDRVAVEDAAKQLHVSPQIIEDWAASLEQAGLITIEYALTNTYLVKKAIAPEQHAEKQEQLSLEKQAFESHSESLLNYLDRFEKQVRELEGLVKSSAMRKAAPEELQELKKLEAEKESVDREMVDVRHGLLQKMRGLGKQIEEEKVRVKGTYAAMVDEIIDAAHILKLEQKQIGMLRENERFLAGRMNKLVKLLDARLGKLIARKKPLVGVSQQHIKTLAKRYRALRAALLADQKKFQALVDESEKRQIQLKKLHQEIVQKIRMHNGMQAQTPEQVKRFLDGRAQLQDMLTRMRHQEQLLRTKLLALIGKGRLVGPKKGRFEEEVRRLNKDLTLLGTRRGDLEKDIKMLLEKLK